MLFLKGIVVGIANIIPGVSGGTMAVILGIYDELINAISLSIEKLKKNWKFILCIGAGMGVGILVLANILSFLFENYNVATQFFFIGLILGSLPLVWSITVSDRKFKPINVIPFILMLGVMIIMFIIKPAENAVQTVISVRLFIELVIAGFVGAVAMIIPGISGSFMIKVLGHYETMQKAISDLNIVILIPLAIGIVIGLLVGAKIISILLKKFKQGIYAGILGLIVGSVLVIYPQEFSFKADIIPAVIALAVGAVIPLLMSKKESK